MIFDKFNYNNLDIYEKGIFFITCSALFFSLVNIGRTNNHPTKILKNLIKIKKFDYKLLLILFWCIFTFYLGYKSKKISEKKKQKIIKSTKKALIAFIIAFFVKIDLIIPPFWLIWIITYFLPDWH